MSDLPDRLRPGVVFSESASNRLMRKATEAIERLEAENLDLRRQLLEHHWVSMKDRPAPRGVPILVTDGTDWVACILEDHSGVNYDRSPRVFTIMRPVGFGGDEWQFDFAPEKITHWMPGPELPIPPQFDEADHPNPEKGDATRNFS